MDDLNCLAKGSPAQQRQVMEMVLQGIKDIFPSFPSEIKNSFRLKESRQGDGEWNLHKEISG